MSELLRKSKNESEAVMNKNQLRSLHYRGTKKRVEEECITKKKREEEEGRERERLERQNTPPFGRTCQQWRKVCDGDTASCCLMSDLSDAERQYFRVFTSCCEYEFSVKQLRCARTIQDVAFEAERLIHAGVVTENWAKKGCLLRRMLPFLPQLWTEYPLDEKGELTKDGRHLVASIRRYLNLLIKQRKKAQSRERLM